ncbi:MAG: thiamine pyrophosphate-binding protein [Clostridiales Family XIII bacterium]|nr:thiamine pyrophosphate-binding protein [Clostridiales Family XIII bacterium]
MSKMLTGGQLVARQLKKEGVKTVFALSGGHIMPIMYGLREEGIEVISVRHESAGGYAADAYARVSGKPGVVITTAGPGVLNCVTPMVEAFEAGTPLIHIGGGGFQNMYDSGVAQDSPTLDLMKTVCKDAKRCLVTERLPEYVRGAFRRATSADSGPVYLEIPITTVMGKADEDEVAFPEADAVASAVFGDPDRMNAAAQMLAEAKKPVLVLGEQCRYSTLHGEYVEKLVNYLQIPVHSTFLPAVRGLFADETKNELFSLGEAAVAAADLILELNVNNLQNLGRAKPPAFNKAAKVIQINEDKNKIGFNRDADVGIVASPGAAAMQLYREASALVPQVAAGAWVEEARQLTAKARKFFSDAKTSEAQPPVPGRLAAETVKFLAENAPDWHVICDGGDAAQWILYNSVARYPGQVVKFSNLGTIGTGAGFSLGAWAADRKPVLYYVGDGSFGFHAMEFETFVRNGVPVVCVISNDSAWGMIKLAEGLSKPDFIKEHGHHSVNLLQDMFSYEKMTEMWGGVGIRIDRYEDVIPSLKKIMDSGKPGILNCEVDKEAYSPRTLGFASVM